MLVTFLEKGAPFDGQAAHAIGTAASNNPKFQNDIALSNPEAFEQLVKVRRTGLSDFVVLFSIVHKKAQTWDFSIQFLNKIYQAPFLAVYYWLIDFCCKWWDSHFKDLCAVFCSWCLLQKWRVHQRHSMHCQHW